MFAGLDRDDFEDYIAERVQQEIMDTHVHVHWPPCPAHPSHPLWFEAGAWRCAQDATVAVPVGSLMA
jgi:hypothetical protein